MSTVDYRPDPGFTGEDSFTYEVRNPDGATSTTTVFIEVVDGQIVPPPPTELDVDYPLDQSTNVPPSGIVLFGSIPATATNVRLRLVDCTTGRVRTAFGDWVTDYNGNHAVEPTVDTTAETWTYGPVDLPAGADIRVEVTHN